MALSDEIEAIYADESLTLRQRQLAVYALKCGSFADLLNNGRPPPQPIPPVVGNSFTFNSVTYRLDYAADEVRRDADGNDVHVLRVQGVATKDGVTQGWDLVLVNPPVLTSDRRNDLIDAAKEILEGAVKWP